jgi:type VI protein secretion system component Hcp
MSMANIWLNMDDIKGEAQDFGHEDEIEVLSWSLRKFKTARTATGKATSVEHLYFTHEASVASASLASHMTANKIAGKAVLSVRKPTAQALPGTLGKLSPPIDFFKITLTNVMVMSINTIGFSGGTFEEIALSFDSIKKEYAKMNMGVSGGVASSFYDMKSA